MRILITGATGFIGRHLIGHLYRSHELVALTRYPDKSLETLGHRVVQSLTLEQLSSLDGFDALINLAGEPIADRRWSGHQKQQICESRWQLTEALLERLRHSEQGPEIWLNASAIGYYGSHSLQTLDEHSDPVQRDFPHEVCRRWEELANEATDYGCRVCILRFSSVLGRDGGLLARLLPTYQLGLGARLGAGTQPFSWVCLEDALGACQFLLEHAECHGVYNVTSPHPCSQLTFSRELARALSKPHRLILPAWLLRLMFGELALLLLGGQAVEPTRLQEAGYQFHYPELALALKHLLKPSRKTFMMPEA